MHPNEKIVLLSIVAGAAIFWFINVFLDKHAKGLVP